MTTPLNAMHRTLNAMEEELSKGARIGIRFTQDHVTLMSAKRGLNGYHRY